MTAWVLAGLVTVLGLVVRSGWSAAAQTEGREITRYDADITVGTDGVAQVRIELEFDFGDEPGHGPFLTLPTRQAIVGDDERDRLYRITDVRASSETAPDDLDVERTRTGLLVRIGDEDVDDVSGAHTYVVEYRVDGWINPAGNALGGASAPDGDELFLDVLGPTWEVPLSGITATVRGPVDVVEATCFAGRPGSTDPCTSPPRIDGGARVTAGQDAVRPGEALTVVAVWPAGTFRGVEPRVGKKIDYADPFVPTPLTGAGALLIAGVGSAVTIRRVRRDGRDRAALGLPPGTTAGGPGGGRAFREHRPPVAAQSTPPAGLLPGELGTLLDEVADPRDVTATLVDLAVRGYLVVREVPSGEKRADVDWEVVTVQRDRSALLPYEHRLLADLFSERDSVRMSQLRTTFSDSMASVQGLLDQHMAVKGWFTAGPGSVRRRWCLVGVALLGVAGAVGGIAAWTLADGLALVAIAFALVGALVVVLSNAAPARTAAGTQVLGEAAAFKRYLETADPERLRLVHGEDLFSRYLPYAIAFGVTERWAGAFDELSRRQKLPTPTWYRGRVPPYRSRAGRGARPIVGDFAEAATEAISAATPGSSGGSGSRGGSAGGGVGGGGGGGW